MITRVVTIQITNQSKVLISFGQKRAKYTRACPTNRSAYAKQKRGSFKTSARLNQTPEARQKRAEYMREYCAKRSAYATLLVLNFAGL